YDNSEDGSQIYLLIQHPGKSNQSYWALRLSPDVLKSLACLTRQGLEDVRAQTQCPIALVAFTGMLNQQVDL
ncbi:hypothetical protein QCD79_33975, partial [Pseudomonas quasicaspiana]|nr:hypothetical protein [Pseudomonas quasicaspiana]